MTRVLAIIINYRTSNLIPKLLESVSESTVNLTIALPDNASNEETFSPLRQLRDKRLVLLRTPENLGFTGGINFELNAPEVAKEQFRYFFLLNPDAFSAPDLIGNLVSVLERNPDAACVSPKILYLDGTPWYQGGKIHYSKGVVMMEKENRNGENAFVETDVFNGCAALFDLSKVTKAGMFNEALFMYYDEADLSIKLKKLGYRILYAPGLAIFHDASYTTRHISHLKTYYMTRNRFMVFGATMSIWHKLYFLAHETAFHVRHWRWKNILYHFRGFLDFTRGKSGAFR